MEQSLELADHLKGMFKQLNGRFDKAMRLTTKFTSDLNVQQRATYDGVGAKVPEDVYSYAAHTWENLHGARKE